MPKIKELLKKVIKNPNMIGHRGAGASFIGKKPVKTSKKKY